MEDKKDPYRSDRNVYKFKDIREKLNSTTKTISCTNNIKVWHKI